MGNKTYYLKFGSGDPRPYTGLSPTFVIFWSALGLGASPINGTTFPAPGISEMPLGSGLYQFNYAASGPITFLADGGAGLSTGDRYISATLDPIQAVDTQLGFATDSFGSSSADPTTIWGMTKRFLEHFEGDASFFKATGIWQIFNRGSTTLLRTKALTNTTTSSTKTGL